MFWIFAGKDRKRAAELIRLSRKTVAQMEVLLGDDRQTSDDRLVIQNHMSSRLDEIRVYATIAEGEQDAFARLISPIKHYELSRRRMMNELAVYSGSAAHFASYLRATAPAE